VEIESDAAAPTAAPPAGWYPDPSGAAQWRRWEGTTWGNATMPFAPKPPDASSLDRERAAWWSLRTIAPWAIAAPALAGISLASESPAFGRVRRWLRGYVNAELHHHSYPALPQSAIPSSSGLDSLVTIVVSVLTVIGIVSWMRFCSSSIHVAKGASYPQRHRPVAAGASLIVPVVGPLVASAASRASLPTGHEARQVLGIGWMLVVLGEAAFLGLYATVLSTSSMALAWGLAALCALSWFAAAYELPLGLRAIAEDHESLDVRLRRSPS
jgi:hypothetical protein